LSGNSLVSILCTIQIGLGLASGLAGSNHTGETLNTLKFAARAKNNIVSHAKKAAEEVGSGVNAGLLERYRSEIQNLRAQLEGQQKSAAEKEEKQIEKEAEQRHEEQMLEMQLARTALKERIEHLNRLILCSKSTGVNSGAASSLGMHSRLSGGTELAGNRSVRSSASQSTLGVGSGLKRYPSVASLGPVGSAPTHLSFSAIPDEEEEETEVEYGEGRATLQAQVRALQADLQDKTRYITTLERRLLQARRSSHSRVSMAFNKGPGDENDMVAKLEEKDAMISDLQKTVAALRSAVRRKGIAELTPEVPTFEFGENYGQADHQSQNSNGSSQVSNGSVAALANPPRSPVTTSPLTLLSPQKVMDKKRKTVDEMSKMLDELIQDKVENRPFGKGRASPARFSSASIRSSQRASTADSEQTVPGMGAMVASLRERDSVIEPSG
jgi:centromeric protein E